MVFGFMKGAFGSLADATGLAETAKKYAGKETMEAAVANMLGFAAADGTVGDAEKKKISDIARNHPAMSIFPFTSIMDKYTSLSAEFGLDPDMGFDACEKELRDIANKPEEQRRLVMQMGRAVANAEAGGGDAKVSEEERRWGKRAAEALGLDAKDFGF